MVQLGEQFMSRFVVELTHEISISMVVEGPWAGKLFRHERREDSENQRGGLLEQLLEERAGSFHQPDCGIEHHALDLSRFASYIPYTIHTCSRWHDGQKSNSLLSNACLIDPLGHRRLDATVAGTHARHKRLRKQLIIGTCRFRHHTFVTRHAASP